MSSDIYKSGQYLDANPSWHAEDAPWKAEQIAKILSRNKQQPRTVAEVGCGSGRVISELLSRAPFVDKAVGFDITELPLASARQLEDDRLTFKLDDFTKHVGQFDLVIVADVFEHVEDYLGFLRAIRSRGKSFVFHIPLDLSVQSLLRGRYLDYRRQVGHLHYFTKPSALATLMDAGYRIADWNYTNLASDAASAGRGIKNRIANGLRLMLSSVSSDSAALWLGGYSLLVLARPADRQQ